MEEVVGQEAVGDIVQDGQDLDWEAILQGSGHGRIA